MRTVQVDIVTPGRIVYEGPAETVIARGLDGELGVQAGHIPLVTPLKTAPIRLKLEGNTQQQIAVSGGFLEIRPDKVTVLAETAELPEEIDVERAQQALERAEKNLQELDPSSVDYKLNEQALQRAQVRLRVASKAQ